MLVGFPGARAVLFAASVLFPVFFSHGVRSTPGGLLCEDSSADSILYRAYERGRVSFWLLFASESCGLLAVEMCFLFCFYISVWFTEGENGGRRRVLMG